AARLDPAVRPVAHRAEPAALPPAESPAPAGVSPRDWAAIRRQMKDLGVARYWVEGEPDGPTRVRLVVPLSGPRPVGQQFEAGAADRAAAAEAALRRVALWKATEAP